MKTAKEFREIAGQSLTGRWKIAAFAGFLASLLGGIASGGNVDISAVFDYGKDTPMPLITEIPPELQAFLAAFLLIFSAVLMAVSVALLVVGSNVSVGYYKFNLNLVDSRTAPEIRTLFSYFWNWRTNLAASLLQALFVFLWSLLFVIPGIIAGYNYAMTGYILAENPELSARAAIEKSKSMMYGNRWRLFCLRFSFIGWDILCMLTLGIGYLWLTPYKQAAEAAFFREVSGTEFYIPDTDV